MLVLISCAGLPPVAQDEDPLEQLKALSREKGDSSEILFLCTQSEDISSFRKAAGLNPKPMYLAGLVRALWNNHDEEAVRKELAQVLGAWKECDPNNGYPLVLQGLLDAEDGRLSASIRRFDEASRRKRVTCYVIDASRARLDTLKREGIEDLPVLMLLADLAIDEGFSQVWGLLSKSAEEEFFRGNWSRGIELNEICLRLSLLLEPEATEPMQNMMWMLFRNGSALALCEVALARGELKKAMKYTEMALEAERMWNLQKMATERWRDKDPLSRLLVEAVKGVDSIAVAADKGNARKDLRERNKVLYARIRQQEETLRPILEKTLTEGLWSVMRSYVTDKELQDLEAQKCQADQLMAYRESFCPAELTNDTRSAIVALLAAEPSGDAMLDCVLWEAAQKFILAHPDPEWIPLLRAKRAGTDFLPLGHAVLLANLGVSDEYVRSALPKVDDLDDNLPEGLRLVALLRRCEYLSKVMALFRNVRLSVEYPANSIPCYYALRDLTGQDFELDVSQWETWVKENVK